MESYHKCARYQWSRNRGLSSAGTIAMNFHLFYFSIFHQVSLEEGGNLRHGMLLIAQMSSEGSLCKGSYTDTVVKIAQEHSDFVIGYICQESLGDPKFLHCTPGVKV